MNLRLNVRGMHCGSCAELIKESISELKGVSFVTASFRNGMMTVSFDETQLQPQDIKQAIRREGYEVP